MSILYDPIGNGGPENSISRLKEGTRCTLVQSGLSFEWWAEAVLCFCAYKNVTDRYMQETFYFRRDGFEYNGPRIPFGAAVMYLPHGSLYAQQHIFGTKVRLGLFAGIESDSKQFSKAFSKAIFKGIFKSNFQSNFQRIKNKWNEMK